MTVAIEASASDIKRETSDGAIDQLSLESGIMTQSESSVNCSTGDSTYKLDAAPARTKDKRISYTPLFISLVY